MALFWSTNDDAGQKLLAVARDGDLNEVRRLVASGVDKDYGDSKVSLE